MNKTRKCPYCAEEIAEEAIKCKHCKEYLGNSAESSENAKSYDTVTHNDTNTTDSVESSSKKKLIFITLTISLLLIIAFVILFNSNKSEENENQNEIDIDEIQVEYVSVDINGFGDIHDYAYINNITSLKLNIEKYENKKIQIDLVFSTVVTMPYLMFMDLDAQFLNVDCSETIVKDEIQNIKPNTKYTVYGIVEKDLLDSPQIYAHSIR
jgi:hypothetical protein